VVINPKTDCRKELQMKLTITSPAFKNGESIPAKYTCDGTDINPPLRIEGVPKETVSLALIVDDPNAPKGVWDHWLLWDIKPVNEIKENSIPGTEGMNDFKRQHWGGPCPPSGEHRYLFKVYALDTLLKLESGSVKALLEKAMKGHILAQGELVGLYSRSKLS